MGRPSRLTVSSLLALACLVGVPGPARAFEISGTGSFGVFAVGTTTRFAVSPGFSLRLGDAEGINLTLHDSFMMFPGTGPFGFNNQTSAGVGYSWKDWDFDVSGSFSAYWMHVCGRSLCGRVVGVAPGARIRASYFPLDFTGIAVTGDVGWYGGRSLVLPGDVAVTFTAGPVIRWKK